MDSRCRGEDFGYADILRTVDTLIMGRTTYDRVLAFDPFLHAGKKCYVFSGTRKGNDERAEFVRGSIGPFLRR
jgi:dihydrofolate reductase